MADAMTPRDALAALNDLPRLEERLTARTSGLTSMVWGLAGAGIFLTYGVADALIDASGRYWLYAFPWMPWVAAGIAVTGALWHSHAVTLRRDPGMGKGLAYSLGITLLFLAVAGLAFAGLQMAADVRWTINSIMTLATGLSALLLGLHQKRTRTCGGTATMVAGAAMVLGGVALGLSGLPHAPSALLGAAIVGLSWFTAGVVTYRQG